MLSERTGEPRRQEETERRPGETISALSRDMERLWVGLWGPKGLEHRVRGVEGCSGVICRSSLTESWRD